MVWLLVSGLGLVAEVALIIVLGRRVTSRYEFPGVDRTGAQVRELAGPEDPLAAPQAA